MSSKRNKRKTKFFKEKKINSNGEKTKQSKLDNMDKAKINPIKRIFDKIIRFFKSEKFQDFFDGRPVMEVLVTIIFFIILYIIIYISTGQLSLSVFILGFV